MTSCHVRVHRVIFYTSNRLSKLLFRAKDSCSGKCDGLGFRLRREKERIEVND